MNQYANYHCYKLTDQDKKRIIPYNTCRALFSKKLSLRCVFIKNGLKFDDILKNHLEGEDPVIFFGYEVPLYFIGIDDEFKDNYRELYKIDFISNMYKWVWRAEKKNSTYFDKLMLSSKIPAWRDIYTQICFWIREVCKSDLPDDVIKYISHLTIIKLNF
jgi:hypothetical protein